MIPMLEPRPLFAVKKVLGRVNERSELWTRAYTVMMSPKTYIPIKDWIMPRTAEEIMCVMGEVILILRTPAMLSIQPTIP